MRVGDVMQRRFDHVEPSATVLDAATLMMASGHEALPVMEGSALVGMVAERDILDRLLRDMSEDLYELGIRSVDLHDPTAIRRVAGMTVADLMSRTVITTSPDAPALRASATMQARRIRRLPVVDGDTVVGMIFQTDILAALVREIPPGARRNLRQSTGELR